MNNTRCPIWPDVVPRAPVSRFRMGGTLTVLATPSVSFPLGWCWIALATKMAFKIDVEMSPAHRAARRVRCRRRPTPRDPVGGPDIARTETTGRRAPLRHVGEPFSFRRDPRVVLGEPPSKNCFGRPAGLE